MARDYQLDARPYFQILHNLLRHDEIDYDLDRAGKSVEWVRANATMFRKVTSTDEFRIIMEFWGYWDRHKTSPTPTVIEEIVHAQQKCEGMLNILAEYKVHYDDLEVIPDYELDNQLDRRRDDYEKWKLTKVLNAAATITVSSLPVNDKKGAESMAGPRDAMRYLHTAMQQGILLEDVPAVGGVLTNTADEMEKRYKKAKSDAQNNNLFIPTGIHLIDSNLGGLRRKELNGVLGFVGQRKSGIVRTIAYNAAFLGFRVLHIPLESDYEEEESFYAVMHAHVKRGEHNISKNCLDRALLTKDEGEYFFKTVVPDYREKIAKNITVYSPGASRSWEDVKAIIQRETDRDPVDLVIIDYLTMLSTPGNRDDIADKIAIIQDAKRIALTANNGQGLCILTPIQGNRNGFQQAAAQDGAWETTGIAKYSELDKAGAGYYPS